MEPSHRQCVSDFTLKLQTQMHVPLWALANEEVIYYHATGQESKWGPKSRAIKKLMTIFYCCFISDILIFLLGVYRATLLWVRIKRKSLDRYNLFKGEKIFVGFGASSEETLYSYYSRRTSGSLLRISSATAENCHYLGCPSFFYSLVLLLKNAFGFTRKLNAMSAISGQQKVDWLTVCALNIGLYTFYCSYWQLARAKGVKEIIFLAPEISAFAAVDESMVTIFHQHGLLSLSILFPSFNKMYVMTNDEEIYFKYCLKNVEIYRSDHKITLLSAKKESLLILSPNVFIQTRLIEMEPLVNWSILNGWKVVMRPTPRVTQQEINMIKTKFPKAEFDNLNISLEQSINYWQPKIIASWLSTGLATALNNNFLPVSLCPQDIDPIWWNMIYPLKKRVLFWPKDRMLIEAALGCEDSYSKQLSNLRDQMDDLSFLNEL